MNSNSCYNDFFLPRDAMHSAVLTQYIAFVCLSVCDALQVGLPVPCSHRLIWNSSKITSRPNSLRLMRWLIEMWRSGATGTPPKLRQNRGLGPGAKAVISPKWCKMFLFHFFHFSFLLVYLVYDFNTNNNNRTEVTITD